MDITNKPRDVANVDVKYYPKIVSMADRSQFQGYFENQGHIESSRVSEYTSNDIQVTSHKLEPIQLRPVPKQDSIQVTSHKIAEPQQESPSQRLLRRKQDTTTKPPEVYLLDLDEVKVHKVKRIFKIGNKSQDDTPRRCHSEERARRRTWHPTDTDRSTRSDGDVVTRRTARGAEDFTSPLAQDRSSRPRQRRSAFMESIHSFFGSRKSTASPVKQPSSASPPKSASPKSSSPPVLETRSSPTHDDHHVARAVGGKFNGQLKYDRVRHLAEENDLRYPQRPKSWDKSVTAQMVGLDAFRSPSQSPVQNKSSSLPPNQQPPKEDVDKNHVIYDMGEKTFKRFSKYLTIYDETPESRV